MKTEFDTKLDQNREEVKRHAREGDDKVSILLLIKNSKFRDKISYSLGQGC